MFKPVPVLRMFSRTDNHENNPSYLPDMVFMTIFDFTGFDAVEYASSISCFNPLVITFLSASYFPYIYELKNFLKSSSF